MIVVICIILGLTGILADEGECCQKKLANNSSGLCPCAGGDVLAWTYDGDCDCKCISFNQDLVCQSCPGILQKCSKTCCFLDVVCDGDVCRPADTLDFATVAKIAILFALIVTCIAVLVAFIRAFMFPRCCRSGRTRAATVNSDSRSLNSIQRFVVDHLRTRPPPYEYQPEKPPSYDECVGTENTTPPTYGFAVINLSSEPPPYPRQSTTSDRSEQIEMQQITNNPVILDPHALTVGSPESGMEDFAVVETTRPNETRGIDNRGFQAEGAV